MGLVLAKAALVCHDSWMPKPNKHDRPKDVNQLAHHLVKLSTGSNEDSIKLPTKEQISLLMSELGRKGGKVGGKRRLKTMSEEERSAVARKAANARWKAKRGTNVR